MQRGLPAELYHDPGVLARERELVFGPAWQLVARQDQLERHGSFVTVQHLGEPLLLVRDGNELRGFYNVCRHRAGPVARGSGRRTRLVCGYHGWSYDLAGRLQRAPQMSRAELRALGPIALEPVSVAQWGPLVFARLRGGAAAFEDWIAEVRARCAPWSIETMRFVTSRTYVVRANWKVYVENYLEGYHIPSVHPGLERELDCRAYTTEIGAGYVCQQAPIRARGAGESRTYDPSVVSPEAQYFWLYPNLMLNLYQGILQTNVVVPVDAATTHVRFDWFAPRPPADPHADPAFARLMAFSDEIQAEDCGICETVHANLASRGYRPGPYVERLERGVAEFHALLRRTLGVPQS